MKLKSLAVLLFITKSALWCELPFGNKLKEIVIFNNKEESHTSYTLHWTEAMPRKAVLIFSNTSEYRYEDTLAMIQLRSIETSQIIGDPFANDYRKTTGYNSFFRIENSVLEKTFIGDDLDKVIPLTELLKAYPIKQK